MTAYHTITIHCDGQDCNQKIIPHSSKTVEEAEDRIENFGWIKKGLKHICPTCKLEPEPEVEN